MTVKAIYENGVFKPQEPIHLAECTGGSPDTCHDPDRR
jgi:hypothetical protein